METFEYLNELQVAAVKLIQSYGVVFIVTVFLKWAASLAAIFLMILDETKWKSTDMLTSLLAPYLFVILPPVIFQFLRTEFGKWIALFAIVLRLFLSNHFCESLEIPKATLLLIVVPPSSFVKALRDDQGMREPAWVCLVMSFAFLLLNKHTQAFGGYKNSFTQKDKITYNICLWLLFAYPIWCSFSFVFFLCFLIFFCLFPVFCQILVSSYGNPTLHNDANETFCLNSGRA